MRACVYRMCMYVDGGRVCGVAFGVFFGFERKDGMPALQTSSSQSLIARSALLALQ